MFHRCGAGGCAAAASRARTRHGDSRPGEGGSQQLMRREGISLINLIILISRIRGTAPRWVIGVIRFIRLMRDYRASVDFELEAFFDEKVEEGACDLDFARG